MNLLESAQAWGGVARGDRRDVTPSRAIGQPRLSVVVPAYNEALRIEQPLRRIACWLATQTFDSEILVIDDGSDDGTFDVARSIAKHATVGIGICRYTRNRGKGFALKVGFERASGEFLLFCDADLATPIEEATSLLDALQSGADVAIGSRKIPGARIAIRQPWYRELMGKVFTWLVRKTIADVSDVTCGFKAFRRDAGKDLFRLVRIYDWSFDAEVLLLAARRDLVVAEVPVLWEDKPGTKVRLVRDAARALAHLVRLRRNVTAGIYETENRVAPPLDEFFNEAWWARSAAASPDTERHARA